MTLPQTATAAAVKTVAYGAGPRAEVTCVKIWQRYGLTAVALLSVRSTTC